MNEFDRETRNGIILFLQEQGFVIDPKDDAGVGYNIMVRETEYDDPPLLAAIVVLPPLVALHDRRANQIAHYELAAPNFFDKLLSDLNGLVRK